MRALVAALCLCLGFTACSSDTDSPSPPTDVAAGDTVSADTTPSDVVVADPNTPTLAPPAENEGFQLSLDVVAPAGTEIWICEVYPMPLKGGANINRVTMQQTPGTHHLTLSTLGLLGGGKLEYGRYDCNDLYGDQSLMEDQVMFYGNQGDAEHEMNLPEGIAATFPGQLDIIHEVHYVNATLEDVNVFSRVNAYVMPPEDFVEGIWGGQVRDEFIEIPASAEHSEWSRCVMNRDVEVLFLASHMHSRGKRFTIAPFDGETVGDIMYENDDWHVPKITQYSEPILVPKGAGFEWACTWKNNDEHPVHYGPEATDEMCNLSIVFTPFDTTALCQVVETSDGEIWTP
jgi:hypothetical protein